MSKLVSNIYYSNGPARDDIHIHNEYEIIFILEGAVEATINDNTFVVQKNHVIFISNLEKHSIKTIKTPYSRYCLCLKTIATDTFLRDTNLLSILKNHLSVSLYAIDVTPILNSITRIFDNIKQYNEFSEFSDELIVSCLTEFLALIYIHNADRLKHINDASSNLIFEIQHYIDQNFYKNILIDDLSKTFFISPWYLSHKFKEFTGLSPKQYLQLTRLKNASLMLLNTNLSVAEIASKVGFNDVNNFIRKFKGTYNTSPNQYRHSIQ